MARLDARVRIELSAYVYHQRGETEEKTTVRELSISGLLLDGEIKNPPDTLLTRMTLPDGNEVELIGDVVRSSNSHVAIQFYFPERSIAIKIWEAIKDKVHYVKVCPYCNHENTQPLLESCENCHRCVNFKDKNYLDRHISETFLQRVSRRVERIKPAHLQRVLNLIDRELLSGTGIAMDEQFVGTSKAMLEVFSLVRKIAPTENSVLILGESGTGKDLTARAIHEKSQRKRGPFIVINCTAIPDGLLEAELFGYEKGAFTGAYMSKRGKFEVAHGGTVFLDEIAELPPPLQAKLLRVIEDKTVERLGSNNGRKVDVRILAATNKDLAKEVEEGRFRVDLYHRINTFPITLPPLRDRGKDKEVIAEYYLKKFCFQEGVSKRFSKDTVKSINSYSWPGNVRELINKVRRAIVVSKDGEIVPTDLSIQVFRGKQIISLKETKESLEKQKLIDVLRMTSNNISSAAKLLGVSRPTIYALLKKYRVK